MSDYEVGFQKPPKRTRFKAGQSGNPSGRPKKNVVPLAECIREVLSAPIEYRDGGKLIVTTRLELLLRSLVSRAQGGDVGAAETILRIRERAEKYGDSGLDVLEIADWLPDFEGQSADQKLRGVTAVPTGDVASAVPPAEKKSNA